MKLCAKIPGALLALGLSAALSHNALAGADDAIGTWKDVEKDALVKVYTCDGGVCVQIVKVKDPSLKDVNNPDAALRGRPIEGIVIMSGAAKSGDNAWKGKLYNREDGKTYSGSITVVNKNEVKLEGCVLIICKSRKWVRAE